MTCVGMCAYVLAWVGLSFLTPNMWPTGHGFHVDDLSIHSDHYCDTNLGWNIFQLDADYNIVNIHSLFLIYSLSELTAIIIVTQ